MKKTLIAILIIILAISLSAFVAACKNGAPVEEPVEETTEETQAEEEVIEEPVEDSEEESVEESADEISEEEDSVEVIAEEVEVIEYSLDSKMSDLLDNPQTMEVMQKFIPDIVNSDRIDESRGYSLKLVLQFSDVEEDIIPLLDEALKNIES